MSRISFFQRFSQPENHATNNTMLMLRHIYAAGPARLERVIADLLEDARLQVGVTFNQQEVMKKSVLDAVIRQAPFSVSFESKRGGDLDIGQIAKHFEGVADKAVGGEDSFLVGLTKSMLPVETRDTCTALATTHGATFVNVTFERVVEAVRAEIRPHEADLFEIADDFEAYLIDAQLLAVDDRGLTVVPCGTSWKENVAYRLYYEPPSRPIKRTRFLGLYRDKAVRVIGIVKAGAIGQLIDGQLSTTEPTGLFGQAEQQRIAEVIAATTYYDLRGKPHRYYLVDAFAETAIEKRSPGGLWGARKLDLLEDFQIANAKQLSLESLASQLTGKGLPDRTGPTS